MPTLLDQLISEADDPNARRMVRVPNPDLVKLIEEAVGLDNDDPSTGVRFGNKYLPGPDDWDDGTWDYFLDPQNGGKIQNQQMRSDFARIHDVAYEKKFGRLGNITRKAIMFGNILKAAGSSLLDPDRSVGGEFVAGLGRGGAQAAEGVGGLAQMAGQITGSDKLAEAGRAFSTVAQGYEAIIPRSEETETFSARNIAGTIGEATPMLAAQVGLGMATGGGSLPVQLAVFAGTAAAPIVGRQYVDSMEQTGDPVQASIEATTAGLITAVTNLAPGAALLRKVPGADKALGAVAQRVAGRVLAGGGAESIQEMTEQVLTDTAVQLLRDGKMPKEFQDPKYWENVGLAGVAGFILGGAVRGSVEIAGRKRTQAAPGEEVIVEAEDGTIGPDEQAQAAGPTEPPPSAEPVTGNELLRRKPDQPVRSLEEFFAESDVASEQMFQSANDQEVSSWRQEIIDQMESGDLDEENRAAAEEYLGWLNQEIVERGGQPRDASAAQQQGPSQPPPSAPVPVETGQAAAPTESAPAAQVESVIETSPESLADPSQPAVASQPSVPPKAPEAVAEPAPPVEAAPAGPETAEVLEDYPELQQAESRDDGLTKKKPARKLGKKKAAPAPAKQPWEMTEKEHAKRVKTLPIDQVKEELVTALMSRDGMSRALAEQYALETVDGRTSTDHDVRALHTAVVPDAAVRAALSEGRPVPAEVLSDYPDFQAKAKKPAKDDSVTKTPAAPTEAGKYANEGGVDRPGIEDLAEGESENVAASETEAKPGPGKVTWVSPTQRGMTSSATLQEAKKHLADIERRIAEEPFDNTMRAQRRPLMDERKNLLDAIDAAERAQASPQADEPATGKGASRGDVPRSAKAGGEGARQYDQRTAQARIKDIHPLPLPELVAFAKEIMGNVPTIKKRLRGNRGQFNPGLERIFIAAETAKDPVQLAKTLAHEIGHIVDYLPDKSMKRGNILGRIATLRGYMKTTLPEFKGAPGGILTPKERARIKREAEKLMRGSEAVIEIDEEIRRETPITPEDVLAIWNSTMDQRNVNPELWKYVARMSDAQKKSIVKEALKGVVAEDLKKFAKVVVEKTGNKIKKTIYSTATPESIGRKYRDLIEQEIKKRKLYEESTIRNELLKLSEWWRGPISGPRSYVEYRRSSEELYADALSVLLNAPFELETRAPEFFRGFFNYLDEKPAVAKAFLDMQDIINGISGDVLETRRAAIREGYDRAEDKFRARLAEIKANRQTVLGWIRQYLDDSSRPIIGKSHQLVKRGVPRKEAMAARWALEELRYADNNNHLLAGRVENEVVEPIIKAGMSIEDAGEFLFYNRIIGGDRAELANPYGFTPKEAQQGLDNFREKIGDKSFATLSDRMRLFHDLIFDVNSEAHDVGIIGDKVFRDKIEKNKDFYATFAVVDYITESVDPRIKEQIGTFKEVGNPFVFTLLKTMAMNRLIESQRAKIEVVTWMQKFDTANIVKQEGIDKYIKEPDRAMNRDNIYMYERGNAVAYEVPTDVSKMLMSQDIGGMRKLARAMTTVTYSVFHPLFVKYNPSFWGFNFFFRDPVRTWKNLTSMKDMDKNISTGEVLLEWFRALPAAVQRAREINVDDVEKMLKHKAFETPFANYNPASEDSIYEQTMERYGYIARTGQTKKTGNVLKKINHFVEALNIFMESVPKIAGWRILEKRGLDHKDTAFRVRNYVGTPNYKQKGLAGEMANGIFMYYNVRIRGLLSDAELATSSAGHESAASWWLRTASVEIMPKIAMRAAMLGLFGAGLKELFSFVSDYDLTNYVIIPLGWDEDDEDPTKRKAVYLRIPHSDTGRIIAGSVWTFLNGLEDDASVFDDMLSLVGYGIGGEAPSMSPMIQSTWNWGQYAIDKNPRDSFRGTDIIGRDEWKVGGWPAFGDMVKWQLKQGGVATIPFYSLTRYDETPPTTMEVTTQSIPGLDRFIKVSDRGMKEDEYETSRAADRIDAVSRLKLPKNGRWLVSRRSQIIKIPKEQRSDKQQSELDDLSKFYSKHYLPARKAMEQAVVGDDKEMQDRIADLLKEVSDAYFDGALDLRRNDRRWTEIEREIKKANKINKTARP